MAGRVLDVKHLVLDDEQPQFCIKIPRHVGNAVRSNMIKRVIREIIRHNLDRIQPGTKAILFVRKDPGKNEADAFGEEILRAFSNA
jgi:ribonuclease P protein component